MNFDRNTIIGFVILAALLIGYLLYNSKEQAAYLKKKAIEDSITNIGKAKTDTAAQRIDAAKADTIDKLANAGNFADAIKGSEQLVYAENELIKVAFTSKGGQPKWIQLKNYKNQDSGLVKLAGSDFDKIGYTINTGINKVAQTSDLYFNKIDSAKNADGSKTISFTLSGDSSGSSITHQFILKPNDYLIDFNIQLNGASLLSNGVMNLSWQYSAAQQESSFSYEKQNTQVGYVTDNEFDYHTITKRTDKSFDKPTKWIGVRQRFFFGALVAKNNFSSGAMEWTFPTEEEKKIVQSTANMKMQLPVASTSNAAFSIYYGPSDYHILKKYDMKFEK